MAMPLLTRLFRGKGDAHAAEEEIMLADFDLHPATMIDVTPGAAKPPLATVLLMADSISVWVIFPVFFVSILSNCLAASAAETPLAVSPATNSFLSRVPSLLVSRFFTIFDAMVDAVFETSKPPTLPIPLFDMANSLLMSAQSARQGCSRC